VAGAGFGTNCAGGAVFGAGEKPPTQATVSRLARPQFSDCPPPNRQTRQGAVLAIGLHRVSRLDEGDQVANQLPFERRIRGELDGHSCAAAAAPAVIPGRRGASLRAALRSRAGGCALVRRTLVGRTGCCAGPPAPATERRRRFVRRAAVAHHDDHWDGLVVGNEIVESREGGAELRPVVLVAADAVQQVEHRILAPARVRGTVSLHAVAGSSRLSAR
jgi:hypothetical protein